ncbi:MAG: hypothetical protein OXL36_04255 [Bryobacterales bacterium]|nr:hypothetical protein [Bryobacterales bacterium]
MSWRSLEELSTEFDLDTSTDREAMRRALQSRLGTLHPDKTGGEFASNEQKGEFHRLSEALKFLARISHHPTVEARDTDLPPFLGPTPERGIW